MNELEQAGNRASTRSDRCTVLSEALHRDLQGADEQRARWMRFMFDSVLKRADDGLLTRHPEGELAGHLGNALDIVTLRGAADIKVGCSQPAAATHGYEMPYCVLETCMADQPFIVDTIKMVLRRMKVRTLGTLNMILPVKRDADGTLLDISADCQDGRNESFTCHLLSRSSTRGREARVKEAVHWHLSRAQKVVADFRSMRRLVKDVQTSLTFAGEALPDRRDAFAEVVAFGGWLTDDNYVFMGAKRFDGAGETTAALGLFRFDEATHESAAREALTGDAPLVTMRQTRLDSPVHRDARMQEIRVRLFDEDGAPDGGVVFQGLFTYNGLNAPASNIPVLRARLARMVDDEDLVPNSHRMKVFTGFFNRLPLTWTFAARDAQVRALINEAIDVDFGGNARLRYATYPEGAVAHVFVIVTRDRFGDRLRWRVQQTISAAFGATHAEFRLLRGKTDAAIWHYLVSAPERLLEPDEAELSAKVQAIVSPWLERMRSMLMTAGADEADVDRWCPLYGDAFGPDYRQSVRPADLLADTQSFDRVHDTGQPQLFLRDDGVGGSPDHARLVSHGVFDTALTDILPIVDNFGLRVQGESTTRLIDAQGRALFYEHYRIPLGADQGGELLEHGEAFLAAAAAAIDGRMNNTSMNRILLPARLTWRQLQILRAYVGYARQVGTAFPPNLVQDVLRTNPGCVNAMLAYFEARFAPIPRGADGPLSAGDPARLELVDQRRTRFFAELERVRSAVEDKIFRVLENLISATLRTNYYQEPGRARGLSFKLRCADVEIMRDPRPVHEIYVYEPNIEGVHLRGGPVARGGLRWSDRPDDYRTEVLGLMLTQMVKNTLIVPVGSKGGFVLSKPIADRAERRRRADELYEVFINGLLDVTDNIVDGEPVKPRDVVSYDGHDPYLVVAADKGTAHLSDTANRLATERGFWLGDAFASGGSQGYDHKIYGITAKGAWVCVQRLFRELGVDTQSDPFTCVGIGDMSGDVFGNGMLLSRSMKLIGAFNHMHIFVDPDPDAEAAYAERERLFKLPRSTWADYDKGLISAGGGVWDRNARSIPLSDRMRELLGTKHEQCSGQELVRRLLTLDCDLLWNGGIGTYVKAGSETHLDVGDKANDGVRVDATELRCRVVGEGGNLGLTHQARVEFSLGGGRITSDAVDNSGGVDLSDHEVNLKILFAPLIATGEVDEATRNEVLFQVDQQVCDAVLHDNYQHALGISVAEKASTRTIANWNAAIDFVAGAVGIDRDLQLLPSRTTLKERRNAGLGLTRPEIARVVAFAKMWLYEALTADRGCSEHVARGYLDSYFPAAVRERFPDAVADHKLRHEIICTVWCNEIVDYAGALLMANLAIEYERPATELCQAYSLAAEVLDARRLRDAVIGLDGSVGTAVQYRALETIERSVATATRTVLAMFPSGRLQVALRRADSYREAAVEMVAALGKGKRARSGAVRRARASWRSGGLPRELARELTALEALSHVFAVAELGVRTTFSTARAASLWAITADHTGLGPLLLAPSEPPSSRLEAAALASLRQDLNDSMLQLAATLASRLGKGHVGAKAVRKALANGLGMEDVWELARRIPAERDPIPALVVLTTRLRTTLTVAGEPS